MAITEFAKELTVLMKLQHENIAQVYDFGRQGDEWYLAMEYVPGRTLRDVLRQYGPLTPAQALVFLDPVLEALAAAHAAFTATAFLHLFACRRFLTAWLRSAGGRCIASEFVEFQCVELAIAIHIAHRHAF